MAKLVNIEFYTDPFGNIMIANDGGVKTFTQEDTELVSAMFLRIEDEYPEAFKALCEIYRRSMPNTPYFRWLVVSRFIRCNFSIYDSKIDVSIAGVFELEEVSCPLRGECQHDGVICRAKFNSRLTPRQEEVMRLYCEGLSYEEVGEKLYISPETVKTIKRDAFRKVGVHDINEFRNKVKL